MSGAARSSRVAVAAFLLAFGAVSLIAAVPGSPMAPPLLSGAGAGGPLTEAALAIRLDLLSPLAIGILSWAAMIVVTAAFAVAVHRARMGQISLRTVLLVAIALHLVMLLLPLLLSRDVYSYAMYGRIVSEYGLNPYVSTPLSVPGDPFLLVASPEWVGQSSLYGPVFVRIAAGVTALAGSPAAEVHAFRLLAVMASLATMLLVAVAARRARPERTAYAAMLIGWNPLVLFHAVGGGHNDLLVAVLVAGAVVLFQRRRELEATSALTVAALIKAPAALLVVVAVAAILLRRPRGERLRPFLAHAAASAAIAAVFAIPFLQRENPTLGLTTLAGVQGWAAPAHLVSRIGGEIGPSVAAAGRVVVAAAIPWGMVTLLRRWMVDREAAPASLLGWTALLALLAAPLLNPWYALMLLPVAWTLPDVARRAAVAVSVSLSATMALAERSVEPRLWDASLLVVHYAVAPSLLILLALMLLRLKLGPMEIEGGAWHSRSPLFGEGIPGSAQRDDDPGGRPGREPQANPIDGHGTEDHRGQPD